MSLGSWMGHDIHYIHYIGLVPRNKRGKKKKKARMMCCLNILGIPTISFLIRSPLSKQESSSKQHPWYCCMIERSSCYMKRSTSSGLHEALTYRALHEALTCRALRQALYMKHSHEALT